MSSTGVWVVGAIADHEVTDLLARFGDTLGGPGAPRPPGYAEALAWWTGGGEAEPSSLPGRIGGRSSRASPPG